MSTGSHGSTREARPLPRPRVWIADDSALEAEFVRRALSPVFSVEVFSDGAGLLEHFSNAPPPDAIVLDWQMPGLSGIEICEFLRSQRASVETPVLMLTVHQETRDLVEGLAAGADDFLSKPYNPAELVARVSALVRAKQVRDRADLAERAVRALLEHFPDAVVSIDADGRVTFANREAERMLGIDAKALFGQPIGATLPSLGLGAVAANDDDAGVPLPDLVLATGVFAPHVRKIETAHGRETTISFRDVTRDRRHEEERAILLRAESEARAVAERANRAKDEFLAIVSHELRTPLNAMLGWTRILRSGAYQPDSYERALETIERNGLAQKQLIEDILDISRIITGNVRLSLTEISLREVAEMAIDAARPAAEARGVTVTIADGGATRITADVDRIQQIVWNLVNNAVKFTPRGGSVAISFLTTDRMTEVIVEDTGEGITPEFLPHIFERFRQADSGTTRVHGGLGLGLAIVRHLAELHGGTVSAESGGPGQGSKFTVCLPRVAPPRPTTTEARRTRDGRASDPGDGPTLAGLDILVVDDDPDARELFKEVLRNRAATTRLAGSVAEALELFEARTPDVLLSDIGMAVRDGLDLIRTLRARGPQRGGQTPAIAVSAYAASQDAERAVAAGYDLYLTKPVEPGALARAIAELGRASGSRSFRAGK